MTSIAVLMAAPRPLSGLPEEASIVPLAAAADVPALLAQHDAAVLVSDGFQSDVLAELAAAVRHAARQVIEVRAERWDGETPSPLSAACRGVISGFGDAGILAAIRLLISERSANPGD